MLYLSENIIFLHRQAAGAIAKWSVRSSAVFALPIFFSVAADLSNLLIDTNCVRARIKKNYCLAVFFLKQFVYRIKQNQNSHKFDLALYHFSMSGKTKKDFLTLNTYLNLRKCPGLFVSLF